MHVISEKKYLLQSFKLNKWTNLNVPIHSRGGCFKIIAWTKRRKLLKQNRNTNELQKLTFYFDLSCTNNVEITIRQNSIKSLNFLFFGQTQQQHIREIYERKISTRWTICEQHTLVVNNSGQNLHMEMRIAFWKIIADSFLAQRLYN